MSAIQSLMRVMTLRDAEAIILEADKVPSLRRRGQVEKLAMPALEAQLLADFAAPLLVGRTLEDTPASMPFHDPDGGHYQVTIEKVAAGLRMVVRPGKPPTTAAAPAAATAAAARPRAWGAQPRAQPRPPAGSGEPAGALPAEPTAPVEPPTSDGRARLAQLLAPLVAVAHERGASDVLVSTGLARLRVAGRLEALELPPDDAELAACVAALGNNTDHSLEIAGTRLRANVFDHLNGVGVAARLIRDRVPTLADLALPAELGAVVDHRDGLVLVCGPTAPASRPRWPR